MATRTPYIQIQSNPIGLELQSLGQSAEAAGFLMASYVTPQKPNHVHGENDSNGVEFVVADAPDPSLNLGDVRLIQFDFVIDREGSGELNLTHARALASYSDPWPAYVDRRHALPLRRREPYEWVRGG